MDDKPPPPPPKLEEIKPYVPPPEFVDIQAPQQETTAITQTTQVQSAGAGRGRRRSPQAPRTPPRMDPRHPLKIGEDYYPDASKRANEEGTLHRAVTVAADGQVINSDRSSRAPGFRAWTRPA